MATAATEERVEREAHPRLAAFSFGFGSLQPLAASVDIVLLVSSGFLAQFLYDMQVSPSSRMMGVIVIATTIFVALSYLTGSYQQRPANTSWHAILSASRLWAITICFLALGGFLLKIGAQFSRGTVMTFAALGLVMIAGARAAWPFVVRLAVDRGLIFVTRVLALRIRGGDSLLSESDDAVLAELRRCGQHPVAIMDVPPDGGEQHWPQMLDGIADHMRVGRIKEILVISDGVPLSAMEQVLERLRVVPLPVRLVLDQSARRLLGRSLVKAGACVLAEYQRAPLSAGERLLKRSLDIGLAISGLLLLSPLFLMIAAVVRLDSPGPVLFRQSRRGFGGRPFTILKFRSMSVAENGAVVVQAKRDDARVTRVGRWIRQTSIDELPQLLNVLKGEMSIVGPRPHAVAHDDYYARFIEEYAFRHHAKPGLTGWAQVQGLRGETPRIENMKARIEKDIWYIDHWSIWLDMFIILRTVFAVLNPKTVY